MALPPRASPDTGPNIVDQIDVLQAILTIMRQRPQAFDPAAIRAVWIRMGVLACEAGGSRRVA